MPSPSRSLAFRRCLGKAEVPMGFDVSHLTGHRQVTQLLDPR